VGQLGQGHAQKLGGGTLGTLEEVLGAMQDQNWQAMLADKAAKVVAPFMFFIHEFSAHTPYLTADP
jgi:hypothetical protein